MQPLAPPSSLRCSSGGAARCAAAVSIEEVVPLPAERADRGSVLVHAASNMIEAAITTSELVIGDIEVLECNEGRDRGRSAAKLYFGRSMRRL
jgi:hypothetical protein